jgi:hypothetical protein
MFEVFTCDRNVITSDIYDTTGNFHRLSQNQQLFCSGFVRERVVFFTTGFGPVTGSKICGIHNLQNQYILLLFSAPVHAHLLDSNYRWKDYI